MPFEDHAQIQKLIDYAVEAAVLAEREACEKVCEETELAFDIAVWCDSTKKEMTVHTANGLAAAIRARNVDSVDTSPERVEKTPESIHDESTNLCQKSTELVEKDCGTGHHHRYAGSFGGLI